jgi:hypothetical protein
MKLETEKLTLAPYEALAVPKTTHRVSLLQLKRVAAATLTTHSLRISNRAIRDRDGKAVNTSRFNDRTG